MTEIKIIGTGKLTSSLNTYSMEFQFATNRKRVVIINSRDQLGTESAYGVPVYKGIFPSFTGSGWALNNTFGKAIFKRLAYELQDNLVHFTTFGLPLFRKNKKDLVTIHDLFFLDKRDEAYRKWGNISKYLLDRFLDYENIIAPSIKIKEELINYGFTGKIDVIYIPVQKEFQYIQDKINLRKELALPVDKTLILSVSSKLARKNTETVFRTMSRLDNRFELVRVGPDIGRGYCYHDVDPLTINKIYNSCDFLLFPTLAEGFGKPVIEAFATHLPVIVSDIEIMHEIAGNAAIYVKPNVDGCLEGIKKAIDSKEDLIAKGLERLKMYAREAFVEKARRVYARVEN
jgi:glycosyltransferase involved in cell wall biosynthesis